MMVEPARQNLGRRDLIISLLGDSFGQLFGRSAAELDTQTPLLELGADSLFLLQASQMMQEKFKVKVPFRLLLEDLSTIEAIAEYLDHKLPEEFGANPLPTEPEPSPEIELVQELIVSANGDGETETYEEVDSSLQQILSEQLKLMSQQLTLLRNGQPSSSKAPEAARHHVIHNEQPIQPVNGKEPATTASRGQIEPETFIPYRPHRKSLDKGLSERQRRHLDALIARVCQRTKESKRLIQSYRPYLADSRIAAGFRLLWKEMFYPPIVQRAQGSRIWDADGNEYIDVTMGFGSLLFGHSPSFIIDALQEHLTRGIQIGPHSPVAGEVAKLICEMTGVERVSFCNSGTEAVMTALRLARAVTGRTKIALFEGCYHGTFDEVLVRGDKDADGRLRAIPMAPGVPAHMVQNVLLLKYNSPESIEILKAHAHELAAVLIEPPRSRRPDVQPKAFLQELRTLTRDAKAALIFDEVVTGFRFHPGGAQAMFDIQADLVTYGKAVGAGVPVAIVAGKAEFMDAVDGGMWNYGDDSFPQADITYFAGTYFKHPMIMPALLASLNHIKNAGLKLQEGLDEKTKYVADSLNTYFEQTGTPLKVARLGSLFRLLHSPDLKFIDLLYYHLLEKGIYICETRNCFLSTAHTDEDVRRIVDAIKESVAEMQAAEFLPRLETASLDHSRHAPLTEAQKEIWTLAQMGDEGARAYNLSTALHFRGPVNLSAMREAVQQVVNRHEALRATFSPDGDYQVIPASMRIEVPLINLSDLEPQQRESELKVWLAREAQRHFDLVHGPLVTAQFLKLEKDFHILVITMHHIVSDGWSFGLIFRELREIYTAECRQRAAQLPEPRSFADYAQSQASKEQSAERAAAEVYWLNRFAGPLPVLEIPTDRSRPELQTYSGAQQRMMMSRAVSADIKQLSTQQGCTLFMTLLAGFKILLYHLTGQNDLVVGTPSAGQISPDGGYLVGYCVNLLPLRSQVIGQQTFAEYLGSLKTVLSEAYEYQDYPYGKLLKKLNLQRDPSRAPLVAAIFNLDRAGSRQKFFDLEVDAFPNHNHSSKFELTLDVTDTDAGFVLDCEYNTDLFDSQRAQSWMKDFEAIMRTAAQQPGILIDELCELLREHERERQGVEGEILRQAQLQKLQTSRRKAVRV